MKEIKVSRQKIEEVTSLVNKIQKLTGKKVIFEMPQKSNLPTVIQNADGGVDLIVFVNGKKIIVPTGKKKSSLRFWQTLSQLCESALDNITEGF